MGLDLMLGAVVLLAGARGWFRGFLLQAIRLGALIGCVYAADPIRDVVRPYARQQIPSIRPELLDKLLWWTGAVVAFVVVSGVAGWIVRARRERYREFNRDNADSGAGFLVGAAKGLIAATFLTAGIEQYSATYLKEVPWASEQVRKSQAMAFTRSYQPADRLWSSPPVRLFVAHVRRAGIEMPETGDGAKSEADREAAEAPPARDRAPSAAVPRALALPPARSLDPADPGFLQDLRATLGRDDASKSR